MKTMSGTFKRSVLNIDSSERAAGLLQGDLATLIDLSLALKQAHWNVVGANFRSLHLQLDEILETVRTATDEIAERIVTIGQSPDGRTSTVAESTRLGSFPDGFHQIDQMVSAVADSMKTAIDQLRDSMATMGEIDPVSEDLLIGILAQMEKHLWMVQAQEVVRS